MIQRIQSIFLFLGAGSILGLFGLPVADTDAPQTAGVLFTDGQYTLFDDPVLLGLFGLAGALLLLDIFLFKNRKLQIRLSLLSILLVVIGAGYGAYRFVNDAAMEAASPAVGVALPILGLLFAFLANKYINKDEKLVRSSDRLR